MEKYQELSSTVFFLSPVNAGVRAQPGEDFPSLLPAPDREGTAVCGMAGTGPTRWEGRGVFLMSPEQGGDTKRQPPESVRIAVFPSVRPQVGSSTFLFQDLFKLL